MGKTLKMEEKTAAAATMPEWVRLFIAARAALSMVRFCRPGEAQIYCRWCDWPVDEGGLYGHEPGCPLAGLAAAWDAIARRVTVEALGQNWPPDFEFPEVDENEETGAEKTRQDGAGRAAGSLAGSRYPDSAGAPGGPAGAAGGAPPRKAPARVTTERLYAGPGAGFAVADEDGEAELGDFREPWRVDGLIVFDSNDDPISTVGNERMLRRIAAAVNLCAGAPTEGLERAFHEIASATPQWALLAVDISNLHAGHMAAIRDYIDATVKRAAAPVAIDEDEKAAGGGRVQ